MISDIGPDQPLLHDAPKPMSPDVSLWLLDPRQLDANGLVVAQRVLDAAERARAEHFVDGRDRAAYVAAHALLRAALACATGVAPEVFRFSHDSFGKATIDGPAEHRTVEFSLSHSRSLVACAVSRAGPVGIDVEAPREPPMQVAWDTFAAPEVAALRVAADAATQRDLFFTLWTLKESVVKALGTGLATPFGSFACTTTPAPALEAYGDLAAVAGQFHLWSERTPDGHHVALCVRAPSRPTVRDAAVNADQLLGSLSMRSQPRR